MVTKITLLIIFALTSTITFAQEPESIQSLKRSIKANRLIDNKTFQMLNVPVILAATGFAYTAFDNRFNSTRNSYIPKFKHHYDDITQYLPAAVMLGLKASNAHGGSRSTWGNMLTADAFSIIIMTGVVNGVKYTSNVRRPANGAYNSFPSGHTATAFLTATMLHKEYGHISPLYSIGAYTMATATGVTRILNNKHWVSDVFVGAAIGIVSVELGYLIADRLFKKKNYIYPQYNTPSFGHEHKPSFIGLYTGVDVNIGEGVHSNGIKANYKPGSKSGVEGAWFINPYLGAGGLATVTTSFANIDSQGEQTVLNTLSTTAGVYLSYPLTSVIRVGTKALAGVNYIWNHSKVPNTLSKQSMSTRVQTGVSASYLARQNLAFKLFVDYSHSPKYIMNSALNELTCGVSINIML